MSKDKFDTPLTRFYAGKNVLITGATGCVGKVLLEKILHSCRDVRRVYVLIREKKGVDGAQRLEDFIKSPVFSGPNRIAQNVLRDKIVPMYGDLTLKGLGLADQDRDIIINEVDIVLHCAASVRFDDPVKEALKINFLGTRTLVELANEMSKIQAFVHVSTAYSNCQMLGEVEEKVYPTKITGDELVELSKWLSSDQLDKLAKEQFYEGRHNSYVFTKALAENYVHDHAKRPTAIARLSVVTPPAFEPEPGFVDSSGAANFVAITQGLGALRTGSYNPEAVGDGMGVDFVVRTLLVLAMEMAKTKPAKPEVYNVCCGSLNKMKGERMVELSDVVAHELVSFKSFRPCADFSRPHSKLEIVYKKYIHEYLFALLLDIMLFVIGQKTFALKKMMFVSHVRDALTPFAQRTFYFKNDKFLELGDKQDKADTELFDINFRRFFREWCTDENYLRVGRLSCLSYMKYRLNDIPTPENEAARKRHMIMLKIREPICQLAVHGMLIGLIYGLFVAFRAAYVAITGA